MGTVIKSLKEAKWNWHLKPANYGEIPFYQERAVLYVAVQEMCLSGEPQAYNLCKTG